MRWITRIVAAAAVLAAGLGNAQPAPRRVALVIGNGAYQVDVWKLANPPRDAALMATRLRGLGFDVDLVTDATRPQMDAAFERFGAKLQNSGADVVGFFYYAGHAAQKDGLNFLVPVDANARTVSSLRLQSPQMQFLLDYMIAAGNAVNVVVLDACRNLPLLEGSGRGLGGEGLADVGKPQNFFIAYATAPGHTAADGSGANSPFTTVLAAALERQASDPIELLFSDVNARVYRATDGGQSPEYRNGLVRAPRWSLASERQAPSAPTTPGVAFHDCPDCPEMVVVPPGSFVMGSPDTEPGRNESEGPQRLVAIAHPFAVGKYEVTFAQWDTCVAAGGCAPQEEHAPYKPDDEGWGRANRPVMNVNWQDAIRYVNWLNGRVGGHAYRLPTEAEWEYAARARTIVAANETAYPWGPVASHEYANYGKEQVCTEAKDSNLAVVNRSREKAASPQRGFLHISRSQENRTQANVHAFNCNDPYEGLIAGRDRSVNSAPVGSFPPNAFGVYDMQGNVWEWVEDCFSASYAGLPTDGSANVYESCPYRVFRGGSWRDSAKALRSAYRQRVTASNRYEYIGFRVARTLDLSSP